MSEVAAIGAMPQVGGFALAGARVYPADTAEQARAAWDALPDTVAVVILTEAAAEALGAERAPPPTPLTIVMPP
jgi:vacuolar-type H+-ATPase subunit F/Vma7